MLKLTETAKDRLHKSLTAANTPDTRGKCFRVVPKDDSFLTLKLAKPASSDVLFKHDGHNVLALPKALQPFFQDKRLDIDSDGNLKLLH